CRRSGSRSTRWRGTWRSGSWAADPRSWHTGPVRRSRSPMRVVSRVLGWLVMIALLLCLLIPGFIAFRVWYVARADDRAPADAIVVLGAAQYNGIPTPVFQARLNHAATLFEEGVAPQVITVGGNQPGDLSTEPGSGRSYLTQLGVPPESILAVETGTNAVGSLEAVAMTVKDQGGKSVVLVSDPTHSYRSQMMASDAGSTRARPRRGRGPPCGQGRIRS